MSILVNNARNVFLGGTCNDSTWRDDIIPELEKRGITYFNPVVDNWDEQAQMNELYQREHCDIVLYVISSEMSGVYSIAEVVDDSNKRPSKTIFCLLKDGFDEGQIRSLRQVGNMVGSNGGYNVNTLENAIFIIERMLNVNE